MPINYAPYGTMLVIICLTMLGWINLDGAPNGKIIEDVWFLACSRGPDKLWLIQDTARPTQTVPLVKLCFALWWFRNNFRLFIPLPSLRSWLRRERHSTVMLNVWANGALKIAREHIGYTWAKCALLFRFTSCCPQLWSGIPRTGHRYSWREIRPGHCTGKTVPP